MVAGKNEGHEKRMNILGPVFSLFVGLFVLFFCVFAGICGSAKPNCCIGVDWVGVSDFSDLK